MRKLLHLPASFILFDTEYTSWPGAQQRRFDGKGEYREVIQLGAIEVDGESLTEQRSFLCYVRPVINTTLSPFIVELTGIAQETIEQEGVDLAAALRRFKEFIREKPCLSYGSDGEILKENAELIGVPFPMRDWLQFANIRILLKPVLEELGIEYARYSSGTLIEAFGKKAERPAHDAVNDMRNLLEALRELRREGAFV